MEEITKTDNTTQSSDGENVKKTQEGMGVDERRAAFNSLKAKATAAGVRRGPGRKPGSKNKNSDGSGGDTGRAGQSDAESQSSRDSATLDAARDLYASAVDAVRGFREVGFAATGHEHWKQIKPERIEAGARAVVDVLAKFPTGAQISILSGLVYFRLVAVGYDVFVDPIIKSHRLNNQKPGEVVTPTEEQPNTPQNGPTQ